MPSFNPLISGEDAQGSTLYAGAAVQQASIPMAGGMNPYMGVSPTDVNAAGTSENIAMHVATLVALALIGIYVLRASGFKFVVAVSSSAGIGR